MSYRFLNKKTVLSPAVAFAALVGLAGISMQHAVAQGIEILGRDGKQVELAPKVNGQQAVEGDPRGAFGRVMGPGQGKRGKGISVLGPDGQPMFLSTEGARSVVINRSFSSINNNGDQKIKAVGKAIVVDANGDRREYELADTDNVEGVAPMEPSQMPEVKKSYMIGVVCQPAPAMVRSQLGIDSETGLLVHEIAPGSPAETAGLKKYDVLLYADDQQLSNLKELSAVVQEIGADQGALMLTVVRGGEEMPIEVTPSERDLAAQPMIGRMPMDMLEMNDLGPGILFGGVEDPGMRRVGEQIRQQMKQMREELRNMDGLIREGLPMPMLEPVR